VSPGGQFSNEDEARKEFATLLGWWGTAAFGSERADERRMERLVRLVNTLGKNALYEIVDRATDPNERWAAFSVLCSMLSTGDGPLKTLGTYGFVESQDERFLRVAQDFALNSKFGPDQRRLAIQSIWAFPPDRAAATFLALLGQSGCEGDLFTVISSYAKPLPDSVRVSAVQRAAEVLGNPTASDEARGAAVGMLKGFPDTIVSLVLSVAQESSVNVRRGIAAEGARLVADNPGNAKADSIMGRLLEIARSDADSVTRCNILFTLDTEGVRRQYRDQLENCLLSIATDSNPDEVRVAAVRALGNGGYSRAIERLQSLTTDPSLEVAKAAQAAIAKLRQ
jgi:HEAT repeat protein